MKNIFCSILMVFMVLTGICFAEPQSVINQTGNIWTLDTSVESIQSIKVKLPGEQNPKRFWYVILTLTNKTDKDADFYPTCDMVTDKSEVIPAGKDVSAVVFVGIKKRHRNSYPLLEWIMFADNKILPGEDNTRNFAVIWPDFDSNANSISLFVAGLSNETAVAEHPTEKDADGRPIKMYMRKTLELDYAVAGDPRAWSDGRLTFKGKSWLMR